MGRGAPARLAIWSGLVAALVGGTFVWGLGLGGDRILVAPARLVAGWLALAGGCLAVWLLLTTTTRGAVKLPVRLSKRLILASSLICLLPMLWLAPVLSTEPLRYRYDGQTWLLGMSPYVISPDEARSAARPRRERDAWPDLLDGAVRRSSHASLNLPVAQAGFIAAGTTEVLFPVLAARPRASEFETRPDPEAEQTAPAVDQPAEVSVGQLRVWLAELPAYRRLLPWRLLVAGFYLLAVGELIAWLRMRDQSPWWAVLFAWQPLVLIESIGMGHQDILGVAFLIASLRRGEMGRFRRAGMCLAAAVAVKPIALLALPFLIRSGWQRANDPAIPQRNAGLRRVAPWFIGTLGMLCLPLFLGDYMGHGWAGWGQAAWSYLRSAEQGGSIYRVLEWAFLGDSADPERVARVRMAAWILLGVGVAFAAAVGWARRLPPADAFYATSLTALILLPTSPPWMVIWPLAMVPALAGRGGLTVLVWAATASLFYADGPLDAEPDLRTSFTIYAPVLSVALLETMVFAWRRGRNAR